MLPRSPLQPNTQTCARACDAKRTRWAREDEERESERAGDGQREKQRKKTRKGARRYRQTERERERGREADRGRVRECGREGQNRRQQGASLARTSGPCAKPTRMKRWFHTGQDPTVRTLTCVDLRPSTAPRPATARPSRADATRAVPYRTPRVAVLTDGRHARSRAGWS